MPAKVIIDPRVETFDLGPAHCTLIGHSLGGLFALYALHERPHLFSSYVAADPSIWWNKGSILDDEARFRETPTSPDRGSVPPIRLLVENSGPSVASRQIRGALPRFPEG